MLTDEAVITSRKFTSSNDFSMFIEKQVVEKKLSYMDAVISFCQENDIDIESISPLVSKSLKEKIKVEAISLNYMKDKSKGKLPL